MARHKRQYGTGCLLKTKRGWNIRWRETEIAPDGTRRKVLRYETLGAISRHKAAEILAGKIATNSTRVTRSRVTFRTIVNEWLVTVLPMYKHSTQKNHQHIVGKHLLPHFGESAVCDVSRQRVQAYVAALVKTGYAPKTIDHIHDVLSSVLRTAVKWGHLQDNPARGVDLPTLRTVRPKWVLTVDQAARLLASLPPLPRTLAGIGLLCGLRRGELFALRWHDVDLIERQISIREAVYEGMFGTPKTAAGMRQIPLSDTALALLTDWRTHTPNAPPESLVFATRSGKPISPNNVLRQWVRPCCGTLGLPAISWLTFRRTYSSWSHDKGVPGKVIAQLMGHAKVDTTLNVYTQVMEESLRTANQIVGRELFTIVQSIEGASALTH